MYSPKQRRGKKKGAIVVEKSSLDLHNTSITTSHNNDDNTSVEIVFGSTHSGVPLQKNEIGSNGLKFHSAHSAYSGRSSLDVGGGAISDDSEHLRQSVRELKSVMHAIDADFKLEKSRDETESSEAVSETLEEEEIVEEEIHEELDESEHSYHEVAENHAQHFNDSQYKDRNLIEKDNFASKPAKPWSAKDFLQSEAFRRLGLCPLDPKLGIPNANDRSCKPMAGRNEEVEYIEEVIEESDHERRVRSLSDHGVHRTSPLVETNWAAEEDMYEEESIYEEECVEEDSAHYSVDEVTVISIAECPHAQAAAKRRGKRPTRSGSIDQRNEVPEDSEHFVVEESVSTENHESFVEILEVSSPNKSLSNLSSEDSNVRKARDSMEVANTFQAPESAHKHPHEIGVQQSKTKLIHEHTHVPNETRGQDREYSRNEPDLSEALVYQEGPDEQEGEEDEDEDHAESEDDEDAEERNDVAEAIKYVLRQEKAVDKGYVSSEQAESMVSLPLEEMNEILKHFELCDSSGTPIDWDLLLLLCEDESNTRQCVDIADEPGSGPADDQHEVINSKVIELEASLLPSNKASCEENVVQPNRGSNNPHLVSDNLRQSTVVDPSDGTREGANVEVLNALDKDSARDSGGEKQSVRTGGSNTATTDDHFVPSDERSHSSGYSIAADGSSCESSITETECEYEYVEELIGSRHDRHIMTSHHRSMRELKRLHSDDF